MKTSEQVDLIFAALAKAQGELKPAVKDSTNPAYRSKYADLASNWEAWREVGPKNGLGLLQEPVTTENGVRVTTRLTHSSGQWVEFDPLEIPLAKHDAHGVGSGVSYGKRYGMGGACGIVAEVDDDGNGAVEGVQRFPQEQMPPRYKDRRFNGPKEGPPLSKDPAVIQAEEDKIFGKPNGAAAPPVVAELPPEFQNDRFALEMAIARLSEKHKFSMGEKLALGVVYLQKKKVVDAAPLDLVKLYLFMNDAQGVADWRAEQAAR